VCPREPQRAAVTLIGTGVPNDVESNAEMFGLIQARQHACDLVDDQRLTERGIVAAKVDGVEDRPARITVRYYHRSADRVDELLVR
jgi:hypothetical protein